MCAVSTALYLLFIDKLGRESGLNDFGSVRAREERGRERSTERARECERESESERGSERGGGSEQELLCAHDGVSGVCAVEVRRGDCTKESRF